MNAYERMNESPFKDILASQKHHINKVGSYMNIFPIGTLQYFLLNRTNQLGGQICIQQFDRA